MGRTNRRALSRYALGIAVLLAAAPAMALDWGSAGAGGPGTWINDGLTNAWFNGSSDVPWADGAAVFGGAADTVTVDTTTGAANAITVSGLTINTANYQIVGFTSADTLTLGTNAIAVNANATIGVTLTGSSGVGLSSTGTATLVLSADNSLTLSGASTIGTGVTLSISADNNLGASAALNINGGTLLATGIFTTSRAVTLGGGTGGAVNASGQAITLNGAITATAGNNFNAAGGTVILGANNSATFAANWNVTAGTLRFDADNELGSTTGTRTLTLANGTTLKYTGGTAYTLGASRVISVGSGNSATFDTDGQHLTLGTASQVAGGGTLIRNGGNTILGALGVVAAGTTLEQDAGNLYSSGAGTVTGNFALKGGTLSGGTAGNTYSGTFTLLSGGSSVIALNDPTTTTTARNITLSGKVTGIGDFTVQSGATTGSPTLTLSSTTNDFSGTMTFNPNAIVLAQSSTKIGKTLGTATLALAGGTLNLRDNGTGSSGSLAWGNNVSTAASTSSILSIDRVDANTANNFTMGTLSLANGSTLTVNTGNSYTASFGTTTITGTAILNLNTNSPTVTLGALNDNSLAATLSKQGGGAVLLGTAASSFGATSILDLQNSRAIVTNASALGTGTVKFSTTLGGVYDVRTDTSINLGSNPVTVLVDGNIRGSRATTGSGTMTYTVGNITIGAKTLQFNDATGNNINAASITNFTTGTVALTGNAIFNLNNPANVTTNVTMGAISDSSGGFGFTKSGGGTLILSGAGSYSGTTALSAGTLRLTNAGALSTSALTMANGTTIQLRNDSNTTFTSGGITPGASASTSWNVDQASSGTGNTLTLGGTVTDNGGFTYTFTNGNSYNLTLGNFIATSTGNVNLTNNMTSGTLTVGTYTATNTNNTPGLLFSGTSATAVTQISTLTAGTGGLFITQQSAGTTILLAKNTLTGTTTVSSGTLRLAAGATVTGTITMSGTGSLDVGPNTVVTSSDGYNSTSTSANAITNSNGTPGTFSFSRNGTTETGGYSGNLNVIANTIGSNDTTNRMFITGNFTNTGTVSFGSSGSASMWLTGSVNNTGAIINNSTGGNTTFITGVIGANVTSIGSNSGTLALANASPSFAGTISPTGGTIRVDFTQFGASGTNSPSNYIGTTAPLVLNGGTFGVLGRGNGGATFASNETATIGSPVLTYTTLPTGVVVGQAITGTNIPGGSYIVSIDTINNKITINNNATATSGNTSTAVTTGSASQTLASLTLNANTSSGITVNKNGGSSSSLSFTNTTWTRGANSGLFVDISGGGTLTAPSSPALDATGIYPWMAVKDTTGTGFGTSSGGNVVRNNAVTIFIANIATTSSTNYRLYTTSDFTLTAGVGANRALNSLEIAAGSSGTLTVGGGVTFAPSSILSDTNYTIASSGSGVLGASGSTLNVFVASNTLTVSSAINSGITGLTKLGSGNLTIIGGVKNFTGDTVIAGGTLQFGTNSNSDGSGQVNSVNIINNGAIILHGGYNRTLVGNISGTGGITKTGAWGAIWTLSGNSNYSGATLIGQGNLAITSSTALGSSAGGTTVTGSGGNGGTLGLDGSAGNLNIVGETLNASGSVTGAIAPEWTVGSNSTVRNVAGNNTWTGAVTISGATTFYAAAGSLTFSGGVAQGTNAWTLDGPGNFTLSAAGSGTGGIVKNGLGTLTLDFSSMATPTNIMAAGAGLTLNQGAVAIKGKSGANVTSQTIASLTLGANALPGVISIDPNGGTSTTLTITSATLNRTAPGSILFDTSAGTPSTAMIAWNPTLTGGIIGSAYVIKDSTGTGFASISSGKVVRLVPGTVLSASNPTNAAADLLTNSVVTDSTGAPVLNTLTVDTSGGAASWNLNGSIATISTGGIVMSGTNTYAITNGTLKSNTAVNSDLTIAQYGAGTMTIGAVIANGIGASTLTKAGTGTLILTNTNTYTGVTTVLGGTLQVGDGTAVGTLSGANITVSTGANLTYNRSDAVSVASGILGGGSLTQAGGSSLTLSSAANTFSGGLIINAGSVVAANANANVIGTGTVTMANSTTLDLGNNSPTTGLLATSGDGTGVSITNATGTAGVKTLTISGTGSATFAGVISNGTATSLALTKSGTGTQTLTGTNTFTGVITLGGGTLIGSTASLNGGSATNAIVFNGGNLQAGGAIVTGKAITMTAAGTFDTNGNNSTFSGNVTGSGLLTKAGSGSLTLSGGTNSFSGGLTINAGSVIVANASNAVLGTSTITMANNTTLDLGNNSESTGLLVTSGDGTGVSITNSTGSAGAKTLTISGTGTATFAGVISTGTGTTLGLTKNGTGTQIITTGQNYNGTTTVGNGTLIITNAGALGTVTGATSITSGATLALDGSAGALSVSTEGLTLNGTGSTGFYPTTGALRNTAGANSWAGAVSLGAASTVYADAGSIAFTGTLAQGANVLTFDGAGTSIIAGTTTASVGMVKNGTGILQFNSNTATLPVQAITHNAGTISVDNTGATGATALVSGAFTFNGDGAVLQTKQTAVQDVKYTVASIARTATMAGYINNANAGTPSATNGVVVTGATGVVNQGIFLGTPASAQDFAYADNTGSFIRAAAYGTDAGTAAISTAVSDLSGNNEYLISAGGSVSNALTQGIKTLKFTGGGSLTLDTGATLTLNTPGFLAAGGGTSTISGGTALTPASNKEIMVRTDAVTDILNINTPLTGSTGGLTKTGAGTLVLGGNNNVTGALTMNGGTLTLSGTNTFNGTMNINAGIVNANGSNTPANVNLNGSSVLNLGGANAIQTGTLTLNGTSNLTQTVANAISGNAAFTVNVSRDTTITMARANNFTGTTTLNSGILLLTATNALGSVGATQQIQVNSGGTAYAATLELSGGITIPNYIRLPQAQGVGTLAPLVNLSGTNTLSGRLGLGNGGGSGNIQSIAGKLIISGTIDGTGYGSGNVGLSFLGNGDFDITGTASIPAVVNAGWAKSGNGTVTLYNANSFSTGGNSVSITGGTVNVRVAGALGTGTISPNGGTLALQTTGNVSFNNAFGLSGTGFNGGGALRNVSGNNTLTGTVSAGAATIQSDAGLLTMASLVKNTNNQTATIGGDGNILISGSVNQTWGGSGQPLGLVKFGSGTLTMTGANVYSSGLTIALGTVAASAGPQTVDSGASTVGANTAMAVTSKANLAVGQTVTGTNIAANTFIAAIDPINNSITLSTASTGTVSTPVTFGAWTGLSSGSLSMANANLILKGTATGVTASTSGAVTLNPGASSIVINANGGTSTTLTLGSWSRSTGGTLNVDISSTGSVLTSAPVTTAASQSATSLIAGYMTVTDATGTGFATVNGGNVVRYLSTANATALPAGTLSTTTTNYRLSGATPSQTLTGTQSINTLSIDTSAGSGALDLGTTTMTLASNAILLSGTNAFQISNGQLGVANSNTIIHNYGTGGLTLSGTITSGTGSATYAGTGLTIVSGTNTYIGSTFLNGGTLRVVDGTGLPTQSLLQINNGIYESSANMVRVLGAAGTGNNQVQVLAGNSGFSAKGGAITVAFGGLATPSAITWGSTNFNPTSLTLNASTADSAITFSNAVDLGGGVRTVNVAANTATMSGVISSSGAGGLTKAGTGTLVLSNTNTYPGATTVSNGVLDVTGSINGTSGLSVATGTQAYFATGLQSAAAAVTIATGGQVTMRETTPNFGSGWPGGSNAAISVIGSLSLTGTAKLDLYNNDLVIDYTGGSPYATVEAAVASGYAGGAWNGNGIDSTTAGQLNYFTLLVLDTADTNDNYTALSTDATSVVVKFTHQDDLNGDGVINATDKSIFTSHWSDGGTGATHRFGDMDFDGVYTFNDVQLFNLYYNTALPSLPEPGSLALLALGAAGLLARKRR